MLDLFYITLGIAFFLVAWWMAKRLRPSLN